MRLLGLLGLCLLCTGFEWEGRLGRLEREFASGDARQRRDVVRLMAGYGASEVREPLLRALEDPDLEVRREAAVSAGRVQLRDAVPLLQEWLDDPEPDVRSVAATALGEIGDPRPIPDLVRALGDQNTAVRRAAVGALLRTGDESVTTPILGRLDDEDPEVRIDAAQALGQLGDPRAVVSLVGRARDESADVRQAVYAALGSLGDARAVSALVQALRDDAQPAQLTAIGALGRLGAARAVAPLRSLATGADARVSRAVIAALGAIGTDDALEAVAEAMGRSELRETAADVLAGHESDTLTAQLGTQLARTREPGQVTALATAIARRLARAPEASVAEPLLQALVAERGDASPLLEGLARSGDAEVVVPILEHLVAAASTGQPTDAALNALGLYLDLHPADGRAADPLLAILGEVPPNQRVHVVTLLGRVQAARALPNIRPLLEHPEADLRRAAAQAIGAIGDPEGSDALFPLLRDDDPQLRMIAARALGASMDARRLAEVFALAEDPAPVDRHALLVAIGGALHRGTGEMERYERGLQRFASGPDQPLAARAIDALATSAGPYAATALRALSTSGPVERRRMATLALAWHAADGDTQTLLRELSATGPAQVRLAAVAALGFAGPDVVPELLTHASEGAWPMPAVATFALVQQVRRQEAVSPETLAGLCGLIERRDAYVRANAMVALTLAGARCEGKRPQDFWGPAHAPMVRAAAARWLAATSENESRGVLERCAAEDLTPEVAEACSDPRLPAADQTAELHAYGADGRGLLRNRLVALRFADGAALVVHSDAGGRVIWPHAPRGRLRLDDPLRTPLQP